MALCPLLVLVSALAVAEASQLTCFFPGKTTKALFGGQCLKYQLMYEGSCRSYFRLESSGLLCLLEPDVFNTARVNPHLVTCPSTEESDCLKYRRYCSGGGQHSYTPCGPSGCQRLVTPTGVYGPPTPNNVYGPPPPSFRGTYSTCTYPGCGKPSVRTPAVEYGLPPAPFRENYHPSRLTSVVYGPPATINSLESFRQCPAGTCKVAGGHCVPVAPGHYGNSVYDCSVSPGRTSNVKTVLVRSFLGAMQTVVRTLQQKLHSKSRLLHA